MEEVGCSGRYLWVEKGRVQVRGVVESFNTHSTKTGREKLR